MAGGASHSLAKRSTALGRSRAAEAWHDGYVPLAMVRSSAALKPSVVRTTRLTMLGYPCSAIWAWTRSRARATTSRAHDRIGRRLTRAHPSEARWLPRLIAASVTSV